MTGDDTCSAASSKSNKKPPPMRVIVEVNPITRMLEEHLKCPHCNSGLAISFPTTCIASNCRLECKNKSECTYVVLEKAAPAESVPMGDDTDSRKRNTNFAANALYVLSFIASGDGGTEAARLLGLLGLPNATHMQSRSFGNIEKQLSPKIQQFADDLVLKNLELEVKAVLGDQVDAENNNKKLYDLWLTRELPRQYWPMVDGCADMGWNQKGSGRKRNSKSGHAFIIGMRTRRIIAKALCSKGCGFCKSWHCRHSADEAPPEHECFINHDGSSGSMEPKAILEMYEWLYCQQVIVGCFVVDDDSSIKARLKWSNTDHMWNHNTTEPPKIINGAGNLVVRPDYGCIPRHMPEPRFVADPNHRRKTLASALYALASLAKTDPASDKKKNKRKRKTMEWSLTMTKMDCRRLSKNYAFMARTLQETQTDEAMLNAGKAVLEHHFDNHQFCGKWCLRKDNMDDKSKYYRDKTKDAKLYERLQSIMARFVDLAALKEVSHSMDTCANESFNNTISWLAPKNKVYCGTHSLKNRISIALGINALGTYEYYNQLFIRLGIQMTPDVHHYLSIKSINRAKRLAKTKTKEFKKKRKSDEYDRLKKDTEEAKRSRQRRDGTYKPGIGLLTGGYDEDDGGGKPAARKKKQSTSKYNPDATCSGCGEKGHWRPTNKLCKNYVPRQSTNKEDDPAAAEQTKVSPVEVVIADEANDMAAELDRLESLPLHDSDSSSGAFFSAASDFSDGSSTRGII